MIRDAKTTKNLEAITSDRWHVVHAQWSAEGGTDRPYKRRIVSEHEDRGDAVRAADAFLREWIRNATDRPLAERDQILVRPPNYKSLKFARRRIAGRR
jgi:hypothetical protein